VQDLFGSLLMCALTGYVLSLVVAALLSQLARGLSILSVSVGLALAAGPLYLGVASVIYQGAGSIALAACSLGFGLYCLRRWWVPERSALTFAVGAPVEDAAKPSRFETQEQFSAAYPALRQRMLSVIQGDRQRQRRARDTSFADAA
jgi:hypothetical protein